MGARYGHCVETLVMVQVLCDSDAREGRRMRSIMTSKKRRRHTPEQIIRRLRGGQQLAAGGQDLEAVYRHLGDSPKMTWHGWLAQYGGVKANDAKRLKELEIENTRLKRLFADTELDKAMLKELAEGNF